MKTLEDIMLSETSQSQKDMLMIDLNHVGNLEDTETECRTG